MASKRCYLVTNSLSNKLIVRLNTGNDSFLLGLCLQSYLVKKKKATIGAGG